MFAHLQDHDRGVYQDVRGKCHDMDAFQNKSESAMPSQNKSQVAFFIIKVFLLLAQFLLFHIYISTAIT